jgi:hypothetical protein
MESAKGVGNDLTERIEFPRHELPTVSVRTTLNCLILKELQRRSLAKLSDFKLKNVFYSNWFILWSYVHFLVKLQLEI